jgi:hypothetical protein
MIPADLSHPPTLPLPIPAPPAPGAGRDRGERQSDPAAPVDQGLSLRPVPRDWPRVFPGL